MGQVIQIGMDVSDVKAATAEFAKALEGQQSAIVGVFEKLAQVNKQGEVTRRTFVGITEDGDKVEATLKKVSRGWEIVGSKIKLATDQMKKAREEDEAIASKRRGAEGVGAASAAFGLGGADLGKRTAEIESALVRIRAAMSDGSVSVARFNEIINKVKADPNKIIPDLTAQEQKLASAARSIQGSLKSIGNETNATKDVILSLSGILRILEAQFIKQIFRSIEGEVLASLQAAAKFSDEVAKIRTVSQDAQLSTQRWSTEISTLSSKFGRTQADVAEGVFMTLTNQVAKGAESFKFMTTALGFSQATFSTAAESVKVLTEAQKSFNLATTDSERTAAILFKIMQQGGGSATEMGQALGRIGPTAAQAGIKLEEVGAAITTLTQKGVKLTDAVSLIQSVVGRLEKPSEEMKKLFAEWGVSSGTAAIATYGFAGVLQKLDEEAQKGGSRIADLMSQFRAIRGVVGLANGAFGDYEAQVRKITSAEKEYAAAKREGEGALGQRTTQQLTALKNFFEQDFGEPFLKGMLRITDAVGGSVNAIKILVTTMEVGLGTFIVYKTVIIANSTAMQSWTLSTTGATVAQRLFGDQVRGTVGLLGYLKLEGISTAASLGALGVLFAGGAIIGYNLWIKETTKSMEDLTAAAKKVTEAQLTQTNRFRDQEAQAFNKGVEDTQKSYTDRYRIILQYSASVSREAQKLREDSQKQLKAINEDLKVSAGTYFGKLKTEYSQYSEAVNQAKQLVKDSLKETEDVARRGDNRVFADKLKYASAGYQDPLSGYIVGDQKVDLLKQRIVQLAALARDEFGKGTKESIQEGRKLFNDVEKLKQELFDAEVTKQRAKFDFDVKTGQATPTSYDSLGRPRYEFLVRTAELEKSINQTTQERLALEERFRQQQKERQADAQKALDDEKERIRAMQQQFTLLEKINLYTKEGKLRGEYKGEGGIQKALAEFDERAAKINDLAGKDADPQRGFQVFQDLARARAALIREIRDTMRVEQTNAIQESVTRDSASIDELAKRAKAKAEEFKNEADRLVGGLNRQIGIYTEKLLALQGDIFDRNTPGPVQDARLAALSKVNELKGARDTFSAEGGRTIENAQAIKKAIEELNVALAAYMKIAKLPSPAELIVNGDKSGMTIKDQIDALSGVGDYLVKGAEGVRSLDEQVASAKTKMDGFEEKIRAMPGAIEAMAQAVKLAGPTTQTTFDSLATAASNYADQLAKINAQLATLKAAGPPPIPAAEHGLFRPVPGELMGGYAQHMWDGGYPAGFIPRSSDTVPAMLTPNEYVMNDMATANFLPILKAMNAGMNPGQSARNNQVTNIGDINVTVNGGSTEQQTINNIAKGLRRGIRQGTITLK